MFRKLFMCAISTLVACAPPEGAGGDLASDAAAVKGRKPRPPGDPGALIDVRLESRVGVLLDELPGASRGRVAADLLVAPSTFWQDRVRRQIESSLYRLIYRNEFDPKKGKLPLPPPEQWNISIGKPVRDRVDGHDYVLVPYTFQSTLLSAESEAGLADKALAKVGGTVVEKFNLPADPELLLERTGYACMDEADFPPNSVDTENARQFFDDTCTAGIADGCHITMPAPTVDCLTALRAKVGAIRTSFVFKRLPWSSALADSVRVGVQRPGGAQLKALEEGVRDNRIVYRYFPANSCAISEGCVGGSGWRRLLQFTATVQNLGAEAAAIGEVGAGSLPEVNNMISFSQCHQHMHFNHYGRFQFGSGELPLGGKKAFCLESTSRYFNNEATPLTHRYGCRYQGVAAGWGDDYIAGLDCQWVDITPVDSTGGLTDDLTFTVNPDGFLCEGQLQKDANGNPLFEPTTFTSEDGRIENRFQCLPFDDATVDNEVTVPAEVPSFGGLVSEGCQRYLLGPTRNCDFEQPAAPLACTPGKAVTLSCTGGAADKPVAVRVCEASHVLGGVPCTYREALATQVLDGAAKTVSVPCPAARDAEEAGGLISAHFAGLVPGDSVAGASCAVVP